MDDSIFYDYCNSLQTQFSSSKGVKLQYFITESNQLLQHGHCSVLRYWHVTYQLGIKGLHVRLCPIINVDLIDCVCL